MKRILKRRNGMLLTLDEARQLARQLKGTVPTVEHRAVMGYPHPETAEKANLTAVLETYSNYIIAYAGSEYVAFEGYKAVVIAFKSLPQGFETKFHNFVVLGE